MKRAACTGIVLHMQPAFLYISRRSSLFAGQHRLVILEALESMPECHDLAAADGPAAIVPDDDRHAVLVRAQHFAFIRALLHPLMEIIREPSGKSRDVLHADEIVPLLERLAIIEMFVPGTLATHLSA